MMTEDELKQIEARANAATPGPWMHEKPVNGTTTKDDKRMFSAVWGAGVAELVGGGMLARDAEFIAAACSDVPALVAEVRRLRDLIERRAEYTAGLKTEAEMLLRERDEAEQQVTQLLADIERIGRERDDMARANVELQERLSQSEAELNKLLSDLVASFNTALEDDRK